MTLSSSAIYRPIGPRDPDADNRRQRFKQMNAFVMSRGGWVTSLPGKEIVSFECVPGSILPNDLRAAGYDVHDDGEGERIMAGPHIARVLRYTLADNRAKRGLIDA